MELVVVSAEEGRGTGRVVPGAALGQDRRFGSRQLRGPTVARTDGAVLVQQLGDLHGVEGRALEKVVANCEEIE